MPILRRNVAARRSRPASARVEQHTKDARARGVERCPQFLLRSGVFFRDRLQRQEHCAVGEVGPGDDLFDAVENDPITGRAASNSTSSWST